jgi:H+/Cl- antiporter ClcA
MMDTRKFNFKIILASFASGFVMWVVGGLYHNLVMPAFNKNMHPHHEGLLIILIAYILLGLLMSYFYLNAKDGSDSIIKGVKIGVVIGILWVFPHGLTMAAVHESTISYQVTNTVYHVFEQGMGGIIIFLTYRYL